MLGRRDPRPENASRWLLLLALTAAALGRLRVRGAWLRADVNPPSAAKRVPLRRPSPRWKAGRLPGVTVEIVYSTQEGDLWIINADGTGRRQLTQSGDGTDYRPRGPLTARAR